MSIGQGMRRAATALGFGILLVACQAQGTASPDAASASASRAPSEAEPAAPSQPVPAASSAPKPMTYRELAGIVGVECKDPDRGIGCISNADDYERTGDFYDVELLPDCGEYAFFGGVLERGGALLIDKLPPEDTTRRATLAEGQFVCVQAIARTGQQPLYLYVTTIPVSAVAACRQSKMCEIYGERTVEWHVPHGSHPCRLVAPGRLSSGCASGWTEDKSIEGFSQGL